MSQDRSKGRGGQRRPNSPQPTGRGRGTGGHRKARSGTPAPVRRPPTGSARRPGTPTPSKRAPSQAGKKTTRAINHASQSGIRPSIRAPRGESALRTWAGPAVAVLFVVVLVQTYLLLFGSSGLEGLEDGAVRVPVEDDGPVRVRIPPRKRPQGDDIYQRDLARRVGELERELIQIDAYAKTHADEFAEQLQRWEAFRSKAKGTEYFDYAQTRMAQVRRRRDPAADAALASLKAEAELRTAAGHFDKAIASLDRFPLRFRGAPAWRRRDQLKGWVEAQRTRSQQASFRIYVDFSRADSHFSQGVEIVQQSAISKANNHVKFLQNQASFIQFRFQLETLPEKALLRVTHLSSLAQHGRYSPITLRVNGQILVGDWALTRGGFATTVWPVRKYLRPGANTISWRLGRYSQTHYWLRKFEISDWLD